MAFLRDYTTNEDQKKSIKGLIDGLLQENNSLKEKVICYFDKLPFHGYELDFDLHVFIIEALQSIERSHIKGYPPVLYSFMWYVIASDLFGKTMEIINNLPCNGERSQQASNTLEEFKNSRFEPLLQIANTIAFLKETIDVLGDNLEEHEVAFDAQLVMYNEKLKEIYKDYFNCDLFLLSVSNKNKQERVDNQNEAKKAIKENKEIR